MEETKSMEDYFIPDKKIKIEKEEKQVEPVKSSSELLAELFQVFNAKPPEDLDEKVNKKHKLKEKKLKKEKHKEKKKKKSEKEKQKREKCISERDLDENKKKIKYDLNETEKSLKKSLTLKPSTDISISFKIKSTNKIDTNAVRYDKRDRSPKVPISDRYRSPPFERTLDKYSSSKSSYSRRNNDFYRSDSRTRRNSRYSRSRSRSPRRLSSHDLGIDKKRLLETARKNVLRMLRTGTLPGSSGMTDEVKDRIVNKIRYSGKTVQDLTEFCKKISNGANLSDISSSEDSDIDKSGKVKPFQHREIHHPFRIQEKDKIIMKFGNNNTQTQKAEDKAKEISSLFPVSSGEHHRLTEGWIAVEPKVPLNTEHLNNIKRVNSKPKVAKEPIKHDEQEPAFLFTPNTESETAQQTAENSSNIIEKSAISEETAIVAIQNTNMIVPKPPIVDINPKPDVSTIISTRLNAMRRLQTNPMDSEALKIMYSTQKDMGVWASSNQTSEQLKANTNVQTFNYDNHKIREPQAWAHPKQLISTVPLQGGMGMYLLKKMGWQPGEGLGPSKNGALEPLLLDIKMDKKGLVSKEDENQNEPVGRQNNYKKQKKMKAMDYSNKHPVCLLNELAAQKKWTPPFYELVHESGPAHSKTFLFSVQMNGHIFTPQTRCNTKKDAKFSAAKYCLQQMQILPPD